MSESDRLDIAAIMRQLPHRYPFLLVDRVLECVAGEHCLALKNVTFNEPFFQGHFPHRPVMPGVLIIEALAQAGRHSRVQDRQGRARRQYALLLRRHRQCAISQARRTGRPLMLRVELKRSFKGIWKFGCLAQVDGKEVASAEIMVAPETKSPARSGAEG